MAYPIGVRPLPLMLFVRRVAATIGAIGAGVINIAFRRSGPMAQLQPGDPAPDFSLTGSDNRTYRLNALKGHPVVIAWFPKAFTGG